MNREPAELTWAGEEALRELRHHLEWNEGFALFLLFNGASVVAEAFRQRLAGHYLAHSRRLETLTFSEAGLMASALIARAGETDTPGHVGALWVDVSTPPGQPARVSEPQGGRIG